MRTGVLIAGCVVAGLLTAAGGRADPPGVIVIRPKGSGASASTDYAPDKVGFIVIRPKRMAPAGDTKSPTLVGEQPVKATAQPVPAAPTQPPAPPPAQPQTQPAKPAAGDKDDGTVVYETWNAMFIKAMHVGYTHVLVREYERDGKKFLYATMAQKMTVARFGQRSEQWGENATMETPEGAILTTRSRQGIGRDQMLSLAGRVTGHTLAVKIESKDTPGAEKDIPWPDGVLGVAREASLLKDHKAKPGETIEYLWYEGKINRVVKVSIAVKDVEEGVLAEGQKPRKLLRAVQTMEPVGAFRLPPVTMWADPDTLEPLKMETDMPMFGGKLTILRTTKEFATRVPGKVPDLFDVQSIRLDRPIPNVQEQSAVVYRVKLAGDLPLKQAFTQDDRQTISNLDEAARTFELQVTPPPAAAPAANAPADPGAEFLSDCFFIDWNNDPVKRHAATATAGLPATATARQKARAVEVWVNRNMRSTEFSQAMASCGNVAKTLTGDCTEYAMLSAGMCRALGVPSRTALGVVYAEDRGGRAFLAYHMWFEVYADGRWVPFDAMFARGAGGPGYVKITDESWHDVKSFAPLLPVMSVLGAAPKFEVLKVVGR
ncbi:transglutaminase domain protein [Fimbriiglobus ruber]|uniref:Transglutaminase domain protein n=1 Tax=Fimbriiglobus ruber TaxID=1908690 RepID=A0A225DFM8_9BACT|nr:transglutaminase domain protein [Fimbriiglobus ruber]